MQFDSITITPYMGSDSITPFLEFKNKWVILLVLTSNKGAIDFQKIENKDGKQLFEQVLEISQTWGTDDNMMYVVGANQLDNLLAVRKIIPNHLILKLTNILKE